MRVELPSASALDDATARAVVSLIYEYISKNEPRAAGFKAVDTLDSFLSAGRWDLLELFLSELDAKTVNTSTLTGIMMVLSWVRPENVPEHIVEVIKATKQRYLDVLRDEHKLDDAALTRIADRFQIHETV